MVAAAPQMDNATTRELFLATALPRSQKVVPAQTYAAGTLMAIPLPAAGVARFLSVNSSITVVIANYSAQSRKGPFNFYSSVRLTDYSGIDRVSNSAYMLHNRHLLMRRAYDPAFSPISGINPTARNTPTYMAASRFQYSSSATTAAQVFTFRVPLSLGPRDPRGSLLLNVPNGRSTLYLQCNPTLAATTGEDSPFIGATTTCTVSGTPTVVIEYYYWDPVQVPGYKGPGGVPLPYGDLALIHELRGFLDSTNMTAGALKLWTFMSGRDYYLAFFSVQDASALSGDNVTNIKFLYDGNTPTLDEDYQPYLNRVHEEVGRDLPNGLIYYDWRNRPWDANSYGSLAVQLTLNSSFAASGTSTLEVLTESLYLATMSNA